MANQSSGFDVHVGISKETEYGTPTAEFKWPGIVESFEPSESNNVDSRLSLGVRGPFMMRLGAKSVEGSMGAVLQNARILYAALGHLETAGTEGTGFTHTMRPVQAGELLPSFTVQINDNNLNKIQNFTGGKVNSMTLTASAEEAVEIEADWIFKDGADAGAVPAAVVAELDNYFMYYEGLMTINDSDVMNITEFELEVNNNLEPRHTVARDRTLQRLEEGNLEVTASITFDMTDLDQYQAFLNGDSVEVKLHLIDVANEKRQVIVTLIGGIYDTNDAGVSAEDLREQEMELLFKDIKVEFKDETPQLF